LPFRLDAESLALGANFTFNTDRGPLDLLGWVEPFGTYEEPLPWAESINDGSLKLLVIYLASVRRCRDRAVTLALAAATNR
jgi:hypothetical protein